MARRGKCTPHQGGFGPLFLLRRIMFDNGKYKLRLFESGKEVDSYFVEIDHHTTKKAFIYVRGGYIEFYESNEGKRISTNLPFILEPHL